jgi:hypothetical protein
MPSSYYCRHAVRKRRKNSPEKIISLSVRSNLFFETDVRSNLVLVLMKEQSLVETSELYIRATVQAKCTFYSGVCDDRCKLLM